MTTLFGKVVDPQNIRMAYEYLRHRYYDPWLRRYNFRPGPDNEKFEEFNARLESNLEETRQRMVRKDLPFAPYVEKALPKGSGEHRPIGQFGLRDKIAQHALYRTIAPTFDHIFSNHLISYRKGWGSWDALRRAIRLVKREKGQVWVFRTDVRHYFEEIDLSLLQNQLHHLLIEEPDLLALFRAFLTQARLVGGVEMRRSRGVPQGSVLSNWISNLYLNDMDHKIVKAGFRYSRYADDIIVWGRTGDEAKRANHVVTQHLSVMKLEPHPRKTIIANPGEPYDYLGYSFRGISFAISDDSLRDFAAWVRRRLSKRSYETLKDRGLGREAGLRKIIFDFQAPQNTCSLISWLRYFQRINDPSQLENLDRMIRERIGACLTQRYAQRNYKYAPPSVLRELGLHSLVGLYYTMSRGRELPDDVQEKLDRRSLFTTDLNNRFRSSRQFSQEIQSIS